LRTRFSIRQKQTTNKQTGQATSFLSHSLTAASRHLQKTAKQLSTSFSKGRPSSKREEGRSYTYNIGL
jgi:hypothetical protein